MRTNWVNCFLVVYSCLLAIRFLWWLWEIHPLLVGGVLFLATGFALAWYGGERRKQEAGYWVEILLPNQVRAEPDDWAVAYHEGEQTIYFYGKLTEQGKDILKVPSALRWEQTAPDWAREDRTRILRRVSQSLDPKRYTLQEE